MDHGANIELRSGLGYTPLHVTAHYDRVGVARLLLESGVRPDEEDFQVIQNDTMDALFYIFANCSSSDSMISLKK